MAIEKRNTILIVDDELTNLKILSRILGQEYTIYTATNGSGAIEKARQYMPDLILLDIVMPEMDGYETISTIKKCEQIQKIPVIFITGLEGTENEEKALDMEAADFIHKPFSEKIVMLRVRNQIQIVNQIKELVELQLHLEAAAKAAETANRFKTSFLASMSHEIRTPLNAILGISEIHLYDESLVQEIKDAFTRIYNSGDLLLSIINDILDMSKIEAGKLELIEGEYDVASLVSDTVFLNMIKYESKPIQFIINIDENIPSILGGDEIRIKQILNNLLSNAFKYTHTGEVELSVTLENPHGDPDDTVMMIFKVRDTGQGMTAEQLESLFDEYSRFNLESNKKIEGTGLGMSILRNLITMMKGEILAQSELGSGSTFTVRLPQGNVGSPVLGRETVGKLQQFRTNYETKTKRPQVIREPIPFGRVLIVDDVEINLYVAEAMLAFYGLQVDTATNGLEAIEKIKSNEYNLVFMDHLMPKMDGIEATLEVRKLGSEYEKLPIIALTANAVSGARETYMANGFNGILTKPIGMYELDEILQKWMSGKESV